MEPRVYTGDNGEEVRFAIDFHGGDATYENGELTLDGEPVPVGATIVRHPDHSFEVLV